MKDTKPATSDLETKEERVSIGGMIALAKQQGITGDDLGRYFDFVRQVEQDRAEKEYAEAMHAAQAAMPVVVKDKVNTHTNSRYASMENVSRTIKAVYLEHGFSVSFAEQEHPVDRWVRVEATVMHTGGHTRRHFRDGVVDDKGPKGGFVKTELHGAVSTASLLSRHLLCGIFGVTIADRDDDGNAGGGVAAEKITEKQAVKIDEMLSVLDENTKTRALEYCGVSRVSDIPADKHAAIYGRLEATIKERDL